MTGARELYEHLITAWNTRDAKGFAALFAEDGAVVGFDGSQMAGPQIAEQLATIFADHPTAPYVVKVRDVRPIGDDAVLLRAIAGMVPPGADDLKPEVNAVHALVAERSGDAWRIVLFQNTPAQHHGRPDLVAAHTDELRAVLRQG